MRRHIYTVTAILFTLALAGANIRPGTSFAAPVSRYSSEAFEPPAQVSPIESRGRKITIFFHGLMVGRYKPGKRRFQAGIVTEGGHVFSLQVWNGSGNPITINVDPNELYVIQVLEKDGEPSESPLIPYESHGEIFNRMNAEFMADDEKSQDYRYAADIEGLGLHNVKKKRRSNPFSRVFHVFNGVLKSKCLTGTVIERKPPNEAWTSYGYIAEILGVEFTLLPLQTLVLRKKDKSQVLWRCTYRSDGRDVEVRALNLPKEGIKKSIGKGYLGTACVCGESSYNRDKRHDPPDYHFQLYYKNVIDVPETERFRLRPQSVRCVGPRAVFPYQCGMILQGKTKDDIDGNDLP